VRLAVYETMRARGWSKVRLANELGMPEKLGASPARSPSQFAHVGHRRGAGKDERELSIDLPKVRPSGKAA
jgi:hypothetical protein